MHSLSKAVTGLLAAVLFLAVLGFGISSTKPMPDHAQVLVDDAKRVYLAPSCATEKRYLRLLTARDAYQLKYKPDDDCRNSGGFVSDDRSLTGLLLQKLGLLRPLSERWNADGTWNW